MSSVDELELLRTTVEGVLGDGASDLTTVAELGLLGLLVAEERGGTGWCPIEATVVADAVGRTASTSGASSPDRHGTAIPWLTVSIAAAALATGEGTDPLLSRVLGGTELVVAAGGRLRLTGDTASGNLVGVERADEAQSVVVLGGDGALHLVELAQERASVRPEPTSLDSTRRLWRVDLDDATATELGRSTAVHDAARVLSAATSLGSLRASLGRLLPYLSERVAFGAPIASFQAIQHRVVDLSMLEVRAGVAVDAAARALDADPTDASRIACVAHGFVAERIAPALDECIQLTGGIGFTWEYPLHHELRRAVADGVGFGSARASREQLLAVSKWT